MRMLLLCYFLVSISTFVSAQTNGTIRTGRPGQAIGPYVVGTGYFQVQSGFEYGSSHGDSKQTSEVFNNVLRYGMDERFELSSVLNWQKDLIRKPSKEDKEGVSSFQLGFRYNIIEKPDGLIPGFGIQTRFKLTNIDSDYRNEDVAPIIVFVTNHNLSDSVALGTNFVIDYSGNATEPTYRYVINTSFPLYGNLSSFAEIYGSSQSDVVNVMMDTGLAYSVNNDFQLDVSGGGGNNHGVSEAFVSAGFSWRVQTRAKSL